MEPETEVTNATDIELRDTDTLIPYTNNPKEHPDEQVKKIASSIKNYGWDQPIVVDGDGEIIKGHGRLKAAKQLGLDEVPVLERTDLTEAEIKAARIADNKTAESPWDDELLKVEVEQLEEENIDMDSIGFDEIELDEILDSSPNFDPATVDDQPGLDEKSDTDAWDGNDDMVECPECSEMFVPSDEDMIE